MPSSNKTIFLVILVIVLLITNVLTLTLGGSNSLSDETTISASENNKKVVNFLRNFIDKVLKAEGEVSFEDRLQLENEIRDIGNESLLEQWNKFVDSTTSDEAQRNLKDLLEMLADNIVI